MSTFHEITFYSSNSVVSRYLNQNYLFFQTDRVASAGDQVAVFYVSKSITKNEMIGTHNVCLRPFTINCNQVVVWNNWATYFIKLRTSAKCMQ